MNALDLYCGAGGATRGLRQAGFQVVGLERGDPAGLRAFRRRKLPPVEQREDR
jgi:site-specific DNA-cytosine methylase